MRTILHRLLLVIEIELPLCILCLVPSAWRFFAPHRRCSPIRASAIYASVGVVLIFVSGVPVSLPTAFAVRPSKIFVSLGRSYSTVFTGLVVSNQAAPSHALFAGVVAWGDDSPALSWRASAC